MTEKDHDIGGTDREHIYVGRAPSFYRWAYDYQTVAEAFGEENVTIMHTRGGEYVLDLSTDETVIENQEACLNLRYDCGHVAYGPITSLPPECPECDPVATDGGRSPATASKLSESLRLTAEARGEHDVCPECGEEYVGLDTTLAGNLVFVHQESPLKTCTVDADTGQETEP